jgi:hypothetical protein
VVVSFSVSGYTGSFTPTAALHYGHDYSLGQLTCSGAPPETCAVSVTFQPTLPGARKDAIFLMNGTTRLATVLLNGVGQGPFALLQPGVFSTSVPSAGYSSSYYVYQSVVDENGTVYLLSNGNSGFITSVNKAGVATQIPLNTTGYYITSVGIDGAGVLYLFTENKNIITYDTVQGTQGSYTLGVHTTDYVFPGTVGNSGNLYAIDQETQVLYQFKPDGTTLTTPIAPSVNQDYTITVDSSDNVFIGGYTIDKVTSAGVVSQVNTVGAWDGIAVDAADTVYATRYSPTGGVAMLPASDYTTPISSIDSNQSPLGVSVGSDGTVFVSNYVNLDVFDRHLSQTSSSIDFGQVAAGKTSTSNLGQIYNGGNQPLTISAISLAGSAFTIQTGGANGCSAGGQIAPGALCQLSIVFAPTHPGLYTGAIAVTSNSLNNTDAIQNLVVQGETYGAYASVSPATLAFGSQTTGTTSTTQTVTVTNNGYGEPIGFNAPSSSNAAFTVTPGTCTTTLAVGSSCQLYLTFSPTAVQSYSGTISIGYVGDTVGDRATATFAVTGAGTGTPAASITPAGPLAFGNQTVNTTSATQTLTLSNAGTAALSISSIAISGANPADFAETNNCGSSLAAGASCAIQVSFTPASVASFSASVAITDNATGSPQSVSLTGTGTAVPVPVATLAPTSLAFSATTGTTSAAQTTTLTNSGNAALNIASIAIGGTNPADFSETNNCPASLAAGASCTVSVKFAPASVASYTAALAVTDNASGSPHTVALSGTGTAAPAPVAVLTPSSFSFGSIVTGSSSSPQSATLSNTGNAALSISGISIGGSNASDFAETNTCGSSLAPGATCTIAVTFTPATAASLTATLSVADNASNSPQTVTLNGTGTAPASFTIAPAASTGTSSLSTAATFTLDVTPVNGSFNSPITFSATGLPAGYTASFNPSTVTPGASETTVTMTIQHSVVVAHQSSAWMLGTPALAFAGLCFFSRRQRRRMLALCVLALVSLGAIPALTGCGGGFALSSQAKTYTVTITASGANQTQTTTVQLTVE